MPYLQTAAVALLIGTCHAGSMSNYRPSLAAGSVAGIAETSAVESNRQKSWYSYLIAVI